MTSPRTAELYDPDAAAAFYEDRYAKGYMAEWPRAKKQRVFEFVRSLDLPPTGRALDFGCGNGVFTDVVRQALGPGWTIVGSEISHVAIENARRRFPECQFMHGEDAALAAEPFDFFFTHHVLEHVYDLPEVLDQLDRLLKPAARGVHIMPCGNEGSYLHGLALLRTDGINPAMGNRFFDDEEGHVRRLRTDDLAAEYRRLGYDLAAERYCGRMWGFYDWLTELGPERVRETLDPSFAVDDAARRRLTKLRRRSMVLWFLRHQAPMVEEKLAKANRSLRDYALLLLGLPFYPISKPIDTWIRRAPERDWAEYGSDRRAGEMFLAFRRPAR
ncbi:MAG: class I SAM-dependent methyltransferase [Acidobacteria bacterium]|nr:class I SAM-dependent methyltransferase [Acidobacteriota bacterium]